jgi:hypothetical protein
LEAFVLLYHWYVNVPPSVIRAATVKVAIWSLEIVIFAAGCVSIIGVWALSSITTMVAVLVNIDVEALSDDEVP